MQLELEIPLRTIWKGGTVAKEMTHEQRNKKTFPRLYAAYDQAREEGAQDWETFLSENRAMSDTYRKLAKSIGRDRVMALARTAKELGT